MNLRALPVSKPDEFLGAVEHLELPPGVTVKVLAWEDGTIGIEKRHGRVVSEDGPEQTLQIHYWYGVGTTLGEAIANAQYYEQEPFRVPTPHRSHVNDWLWEIVEDREPS